MNNNQFKQANSEIEKNILKNENLKRSVVCIALLGSVADSEDSTEWSDLDVLVILKADELGNINMTDLNCLKKISKKASKKYKFPISILSHTIDDFEKYISFEYLKHYSFGICTYPSSGYLQRTINGILSKRNLSEKVRRAYCAYHMRHTRFNLFRKYVSINCNNSPDPAKDFARLLIDKMIKVTDLALNYIDVWAKNKNEIYELAEEKISIDTKPFKKSLLLRKNWKAASQKELDLFIPQGLKYLTQVISIILKDYQLPTPEEKMPL